MLLAFAEDQNWYESIKISVTNWKVLEISSNIDQTENNGSFRLKMLTIQKESCSKNSKIEDLEDKENLFRILSYQTIKGN